jgi:hypothetical protein
MESNLGAASGGLCSTCVNAPNCVYRAMRGFDAMFCEMFDDRPAEVTVKASPLSRKLAEHPLKGLCVSCSKKTTCSLPKPKGGVWRCHEYE